VIDVGFNYINRHRCKCYKTELTMVPSHIMKLLTSLYWHWSGNNTPQKIYRWPPTGSKSTSAEAPVPSEIIGCIDTPYRSLCLYMTAACGSSKGPVAESSPSKNCNEGGSCLSRGRTRDQSTGWVSPYTWWQIVFAVMQISSNKLTMFIIGNILQNQHIFRTAKADNWQTSIYGSLMQKRPRPPFP